MGKTTALRSPLRIPPVSTDDILVRARSVETQRMLQDGSGGIDDQSTKAGKFPTDGAAGDSNYFYKERRLGVLYVQLDLQ